MNDLKPCPYCGDTYIRPHVTKGGNYTIGCNTVNCIGLHCEGKLFKTEADAIEAWNRRVAIEPERKTGTWQRKYSRPGVYADLCWHCSICGGKFSDTYANMWHYCPDCGAVMRGEQ